MGTENREGGVVLLQEEHLSMTNRWGKPVVGWQPNSEGLGGLHNSIGFGMARVVHQKLENGEPENLYDQPLLIENAGSIVIAQHFDGRIGLVPNFRMVGERILPEAGANYVRQLQEKKLWSKLINSLGRHCWEAPRGLAPPTKGSEPLEEFILRTAKVEAKEEAGFIIEGARVVGRVNANSTFFAHSQYVVHARITVIGDSQPEAMEMIGKARLFRLPELRHLNKTGQFDDGLTLAAMALCGLSL